MLELGALVVFFAIVLLVLGLTQRDKSPMNARLANLRGETSTASYTTATREQSIGTRVLGPLAGSLGSKLENLLPSSWIRGIRAQLIQAGEPVSLNGFLTVTAISEIAGLAFTFVMLTAANLDAFKMTAMIAGGAGGGILLPKIWLSNRARSRQKEILKSLPDAFDLITVCVESGLGLDAALARVAEKTEGPFGEELAVALKEVSLGKLRRDALREMSDRIGIPDLSTFITAIIQAETMGTSIATVLRVQAEQMRIRRRQRAEQQAQQAPVKMIFPLVLCIFPTLFVVILGPAALQIMEQLGGE